MQQFPSRSDIEQAHKRIGPYIHRTPVFTSVSVDVLADTQVLFKCENLQKVGAFKMRGASNAVLTADPEQLKNGVATHSSGNHAQALARAAQIADVPATIVMPSTAPEVKKRAVAGYGANIIECEPTLEARESTLNAVIEQTGALFVHPYDNFRIIEGQATCAKELIEDLDDLDVIIAPVGGGGLMAGTCLSATYFGSNLKVYGAEPTGADDAKRSLDSGKLVPSVNPNTIADGLLTSLGKRNFPILQEHLSDILLVDDAQIVEAMRLIWERMKLIVEPSSAVPLAAIIKNPDLFRNKKTGVILTGGNVDLTNLPFK